MRAFTRIVIFALLLLPFLLYGSVFSSVGYGEYVGFGDAIERGMAGAKVFLTPEVHTFKVTFVTDFLRIKDKENIRDEREFSVYDIRYYLPLPNKFGLAFSLTNLLSRNFYIESRDNQIGDIRYDRIVTGSGGTHLTSFALYKSFPSFSFGLGGLLPFGETEEIWETNFTSSEYDKTIDIVSDTTHGYGLISQIRFQYKRMDISLLYYNYFNSLELPPQVSMALLYAMNPNWTIGANIDMELWGCVDNNFSTGTNLGLAISNNRGRYTLRSGVFSRSWYYRDIRELGGCLGTSYLFPDRLGELSIALEAGRRGWEDIEELFVRLSVTLCGKEIW